MNPRVEFDLKKLENNINQIKKACPDITLIFPVKCCTNKKVLELVSKLGLGFDVSNNNEMLVIREYIDGRFISVSGPLSKYINNNQNNNIHIAINNINDLKENYGVRVNFNYNKNFDISHFGTNVEMIDKNIVERIEYVHFHNSDKRTVDKCNEIIKEVKYIVKKFINLKYLNIGGHLEDLSFKDAITYINNVRKVVPNNIKVIAELGDFLFKDCGTLYCKVIDSKIENKCQYVILNFSKMANQRWSYPVFNKLNNKDTIKTIFYGCSCCETDIFLETECNHLNVGDKLEFYNISPYTYQWNMTFNGVKKMKYIFK